MPDNGHSCYGPLDNIHTRTFASLAAGPRNFRSLQQGQLIFAPADAGPRRTISGSRSRAQGAVGRSRTAKGRSRPWSALFFSSRLTATRSRVIGVQLKRFAAPVSCIAFRDELNYRWPSRRTTVPYVKERSLTATLKAPAPGGHRAELPGRDAGRALVFTVPCGACTGRMSASPPRFSSSWHSGVG